MAEELKPCPCCHHAATPYWKGAGCTNTGCMLCGLHFGFVEWQNHRAQPPSQGGEAVAMRQRFSQIEDEIMEGKHTAASVFTQMRTAALYTNPADPGAVPVRRELLENCANYMEGSKSMQVQVWYAELRQLLADSEEVKK